MAELESKFAEGNIKVYQHWILTVSFRQHTLGCLIVMAKREVERISELSDPELLELRQVMRDLETALNRASDFQPDRFNYLQLGNALHQLHFHCIPRYQTIRHFAGQEWVDTTFGRPPIFLKKDQESSVELVRTIRDTLQPFFDEVC
jgi:diadenosine tetraphosphate (Ap4A) HIT family hydrolase